MLRFANWNQIACSNKMSTLYTMVNGSRTTYYCKMEVFLWPWGDWTPSLWPIFRAPEEVSPFPNLWQFWTIRGKNSLLGGTDYFKYFLKFLMMLNGIFCFRFRFCRRLGHLITSLKNGVEIQVDGHGCHLDSFWILHYFCFLHETRLCDEIRVFN